MEKISNIRTSATADQEHKLWIEILGQRNRMLINSDWAVLPDVRIRNQSEWLHWRTRLRKINNRSMTREEAQKKLAELALQVPSTIWKGDLSLLDSTELVSLRGLYIKELHYLFKDRYKDYLPFQMSDSVLREKFDEAVDWVRNPDPVYNDKVYPLMELESKIHNKPIEAVAKEFISLKQLWLNAVVRAEKELHEAIALVNTATSVVELESIVARFL